MKRQILVLLAAAALATGCYRDNASPFVHGAQNKPGDVTSGKTTAPAELSTAPVTDTGAAATGTGDVTSPAAGAAAPSASTGTAATTTYGQSGGQAGGVQAPKP